VVKRLFALVTVAFLLLPIFGCTREKPLSPPSFASPAPDSTSTAEDAPASMAAGASDATSIPVAPESTLAPPVVSDAPPAIAISTPTRNPASASTTRYVVQQGDWIYKIARQFHQSPEAIVTANPGINADLLVAGQVLIIPGSGDPNPTRAVSNPSSTPTVVQPIKTTLPTAKPTAWLPSPTAKSTNNSPRLAVKSPAQRYFPPPSWILGPIQGTAEDEKYINDLFFYLDQYNIPVTAFHFDSDAWQTCANNAEFKWSDALIGRFRVHNPPVRAVFWILPLIGKKCNEYGIAASNGYFVRNGDGSPLVTSSWQGTGSWIDFNNRDAVAYWHSLLDRIFARAPGVIGGFYTDDLRPDLPNDTGYSDAFVRDLLDYTRSKIPDGDVVMKSYGSNTPDNNFLARYGHLSYVNDLDSTFAGMRDGIRRVLAASTILPAPFNEFTGYAFRTPDSEIYIRRMHWGAFQPIMENDPLPKNAVPWDPQYTPQVLQSYQYYSTLHWELAPYFHTYDQLAYQNNTPIFVQPNASQYSTGIGKEFFVQYITDYMQSINITLPPGQWVNYWNEQELRAGGQTFSYPVPLGREPIFVANGAIIPMQVRDSVTGHGTSASAGALTINVFPSGHSSFSYFDASGKWIVFDANQTGSQLSLCTSAPPSQPLIYRIAHWSSAPTQVTTRNGAIGVNTNLGMPLPTLAGEAAVDASAGGWFFDAARQHLIIKLTNLGVFCP
jgi:LysM repeat protein